MTANTITRLPDEKQISGLPAQYEVFTLGTDLDGSGPVAWNIAETSQTEEGAMKHAERLVKWSPVAVVKKVI